MAIHDKTCLFGIMCAFFGLSNLFNLMKPSMSTLSYAIFKIRIYMRWRFACAYDVSCNR